MKCTSVLLGVAIILAMPTSTLAQTKKGGTSDAGQSQFAPGQKQTDPGTAKQFAPGQKQTDPGTAKKFAPGQQTPQKN